jgi:hypothetical protein
LRSAQIAALAVAIVDWLALRRGWVSHSPALLAGLVALLLLVLTVGAGRVIAGLARGSVRCGRGGGELLLVLGLLLAASAGMTNWLLSLQGFTILIEGERIELAAGRQLQDFAAGPFSDLAEMGITLELRDLELSPEPGGYVPESRIVCSRPGGEPEPLAVRPGASAACGSLVLHQGAFGFAPRVVIARDGGVVFDRVVPFLTRREGARGVVFEGDFTVASEALQVSGVVNLESLDAWMRGHAKLRLEVNREGRLIGRGELLPGHFAGIEEGYRIGFAGLERWSEIDVSRRDYGRWVLVGGGMSILGVLVWALAAWRNW